MEQQPDRNWESYFCDSYTLYLTVAPLLQHKGLPLRGCAGIQAGNLTMLDLYTH